MGSGVLNGLRFEEEEEEEEAIDAGGKKEAIGAK